MKTISKRFISTFVLILMIFSISGCTTDDSSVTETTVETKPYELMAGYENISALPEYNKDLLYQLSKDFDNNAAAAEKNYAKEYKILNATVEEIPTDSQIKITVDGSSKERTCYMSEDQNKDVILSLNKGDTVHLIGRLQFGPLPPEYGIQFTFKNCFIVSEEELTDMEQK